MALSSAEAETYGIVTASCETFGIVAYAKDVGMELGAQVYLDAAAALGIIARQAHGKVKHIRTQALWLQETRATGRLKYGKVKGGDNPADAVTKHLNEKLLSKHTLKMFMVHGGGSPRARLHWIQPKRK